MSKKAHRTGRAPIPPSSRHPERSWRDRVPLQVAVAAIGVIVLVLGVALVAFAAFATGGPQSLPAGTQVFAETNHDHVDGRVTYDHVPPAGGAHNAVQLNCGVYGQQVPNENAVHSLEHGAVWVTYSPSLSADQLAQLQGLITSSYVGSERYLILSPYPGLPAPIVASAWGYQLQVQQATDPRLTQFIHRFAGGGQGGEAGGACTGGLGSPLE